MIRVGRTTLTFEELLAIQPDGLGWRTVARGASVKIGDRVRLGDGVRLGAGVYIGDRANLGAGVYIGAHANLGAGVYIGDRAQLGEGVYVGDRAQLCEGTWLGDRARIGDRARGVIAYLGPEPSRGHASVAYWGADGEVRISAGCRDFTLAEARAHWGVGYKGKREIGDEYLALCDYVERIATRLQPLPPLDRETT